MKTTSLILLILLFCSCEEDALRMEKRVKFKADSLFQLQYQILLKEQDSICIIRKNANMQVLLDSIVKIRKQEIIKLQKGL